MWWCFYNGQICRIQSKRKNHSSGTYQKSSGSMNVAAQSIFQGNFGGRKGEFDVRSQNDFWRNSWLYHFFNINWNTLLRLLNGHLQAFWNSAAMLLTKQDPEGLLSSQVCKAMVSSYGDKEGDYLPPHWLLPLLPHEVRWENKWVVAPT